MCPNLGHVLEPKDVSQLKACVRNKGKCPNLGYTTHLYLYSGSTPWPWATGTWTTTSPPRPTSIDMSTGTPYTVSFNKMGTVLGDTSSWTALTCNLGAPRRPIFLKFLKLFFAVYVHKIKTLFKCLFSYGHNESWCL